MASSDRSGVLLLVAGVVSLLLGAYLALGSIGDARQATASQAWPTVPGEVTTFAYEQVRRDEVDIQRDVGPENVRQETVQTLDWEYTYAVDGTTYTGRRATWGRPDRRSIYPLGSEVAVHYDPDDPSTAILQPESKPASRAGAVLVLLAMGGYMVYAGAGSRRRAKAA